MTMLRGDTRRWVLGAMMALGATMPGCAHTLGAVAGEAAQSAAEEAPEPLISSTLDALEDPETRASIARVLGMPEVQDATRELVGNVTDGTLDALSDEERAARLEAMAEGFIARTSAAVSEALARDIGPALAQTMSRTLSATLARVLDEETTQQIATAVATVAQESAAALALALREELGPALRAVLREDLAPAFREALADPEVQAAIGGATRTMSRELVLGVQDAFAEIEARDGHGQTDTVLTRLQDFAGEGVGLFQILLVAAILALLAMVAWLIRSTAKSNAREADAQRREAAIIALTRLLKSTESRPWSGELLDVLEANLRDDDQSLRELLEKNRRSARPPRDEPGGGPLAPAGT